MGSRYPPTDIDQGRTQLAENLLAAQLLISLAIDAMQKGRSTRAIDYIDMTYKLFDAELERVTEESHIALTSTTYLNPEP